MYFPSSQIKTNLYTNGGEFIKKDSKENYIGFYWKTSSNKFYTGKTPNDLVIEELEKPDYTEDRNYNIDLYTSINQNSSKAQEYLKINQSFSSPLILPSSYNPKPSDKDYENGEFTRYFVKKTNELLYIEVNEETYNKINTQDPSYLYQIYFPFKYNWKISGDKIETYHVNKKTTQYMSKTFNLPKLEDYLKADYLKFYI